MKKFLLVLVLMMVAMFSVSATEWFVLKTGYGNETAGVGVAIDYRAQNMGVVVGVGKFYDIVGGSAGFKVYFSEESPWWIGANIGVLGWRYQWNSLQGVTTNELVYGPSLVLGISYKFNSGFYLDSSIGAGYGEMNAGEEVIPTIQFSVGYAF